MAHGRCQRGLDAPRPAVVARHNLFFQNIQCTKRAADFNPHAVAIFLLQVKDRSGDRFLNGCPGVVGDSTQTFSLFGIHELRRIEVDYRARELGGIIGGVEASDAPTRRDTGLQRGPGIRPSMSQWRDGSNAGDNNAWCMAVLFHGLFSSEWCGMPSKEPSHTGGCAGVNVTAQGYKNWRRWRQPPVASSHMLKHKTEGLDTSQFGRLFEKALSRVRSALPPGTGHPGRKPRPALV